MRPRLGDPAGHLRVISQLDRTGADPWPARKHSAVRSTCLVAGQARDREIMSRAGAYRGQFDALVIIGYSFEIIQLPGWACEDLNLGPLPYQVNQTGMTRSDGVERGASHLRKRAEWVTASGNQSEHVGSPDWLPVA